MRTRFCLCWDGLVSSDEKANELEGFELHLTIPRDIDHWGEEFPEVIRNTKKKKIADRCDVEIELGLIYSKISIARRRE